MGKKISIVGLIALSAYHASASTALVTLDLESLHSSYGVGDSWNTTTSFFAEAGADWQGTVDVSASWQGNGGVYAPGLPPTYLNSPTIGSLINVVSNDGELYFADDPAAATFSSFFFDFAGLAGGSLPGGSYLLFSDVEYGLSASFSAPGGQWLQTVATGDYTSPEDPGISVPSLAFTGGGTYDILGAPLAGDGNFLLLRTTRDVTAFKFEGHHNDAGVFGFTLLAPIPEPSRAVLLSLSGILLLGRRRVR